MTIIEAAKSGKKFKRPYHGSWYDPKDLRAHMFMIDDILRDDWATEEEKFEVTEEQLREAWDNTGFIESCRINVSSTDIYMKKKFDAFTEFLSHLRKSNG